jgi:GT2 family glycosyltransferase
VVVARDPGAWFPECLQSLAAQDYGNLSILVIDAGSEIPVKPAVEEVAPTAHVWRLDGNPGYGAAANEVLDLVEGASFFLFCHDDVALEPGAVRLLVEEAFRSNAGVVGPKLLNWDDSRRLLQVGEGLDKLGYTVPVVEVGELDQSQHDAVKPRFTVPGACSLVRTDLFSTLGGFDEGITFLLDDVSLCWRAHLAGATVLVAPQARARHVQALGLRLPLDQRRRLLSRHRLRVVFTCYSALSLLRVLPQTVVLHLAESLYSLLIGRAAHARELAGAWSWNLRRLGEVRAARRQVRTFRAVRDREIRQLMVGGSARFSQFLRGQIDRSDDRAGAVAGVEEPAPLRTRSGTVRVALGVWAALALVLVAGSRHLLTRGIPSIGELIPFDADPSDLLGEWVSGWRTAGLGSDSPAPTAFGLLGGLGGVFLGAMGTLRVVLTLGLLPLGALGAYRLPAPTGSRRAQTAALVVYAANPLPYNALAAGRWTALAVYAAAPFLLGQLGRAARLAPFGDVGGAAGPTVGVHPLWRHVIAIGLLAAFVAALLPAMVALVLVVAVALVAGSLLALAPAGSLRLLAAGAGGALIGGLLHVPWSFDFLQPGSTLTAFLGPERGEGRYTLPDLLRFETGAMGGAPLGWALVVAAVLPLLIGREWRLTWAVRSWMVAVTCWALAWGAQEGWFDFGLPVAEVLLAPAAAALALSVAMGVVAFDLDLPGYRFGWRQMASAATAVAVVAAALPVLGAAIDGDWSMPGGDHGRALVSLDEARSEEPFRVLWLGDPDVLPLGSWELDDGLAYATTDDGTPQTHDLWAGSDEGPTRLLADALQLAAAGQTARLGRLLAPMAIRYVVVLERPAPAPFSEDVVPVPAEYTASLAAQLDLRRVDRPAGITLYENEAYSPQRAELPGDLTFADADADAGSGLLAGLGLDFTDARAALVEEAGRDAWRGDIGSGRLFHSMRSSDRWELRVGGNVVEPTPVLGWASVYDVPQAGAATLHYRTSPLRYAMIVIQALLWLAALRITISMRARRDDPEPELDAP